MKHCLILALTLFCSGCATTHAKIHAYGLHAITAYGIISLGVLDYERQADPKAD